MYCFHRSFHDEIKLVSCNSDGDRSTFHDLQLSWLVVITIEGPSSVTDNN